MAFRFKPHAGMAATAATLRQDSRSCRSVADVAVSDGCASDGPVAGVACVAASVGCASDGPVADVATSAGNAPVAVSQLSQPVLCADCQQFRPRPDSQPDGYCRRYREPTWSAIAFHCQGFDAAEGTLEARRRTVETVLSTHPELKRAFDVADEPLAGSSSEPVSVVLAVRHGEQILTGEVLVPPERWEMFEFLAIVDPPERPQ